MEKIYKTETLQIGSKYAIKVSNTLGLYSIEFELSNNKNLINYFNDVNELNVNNLNENQLKTVNTINDTTVTKSTTELRTDTKKNDFIFTIF